MAKVLVAWELGSGSGHLVPLRPIIEGLLRRGHAVTAAVRDVPKAGGVLAGCPGELALLPAPFKLGPVRDPIRPPITLAHILHNVGFADDLELEALVQAWRRIFEHEKPDLLLCDHSPTALLASRGLPMRRAAIGLGFFCPPDRHPLPRLRPQPHADAQRLVQDEGDILARMNRVLDHVGQPPIDRVTQIYGDADGTFLATFEELDHYSRPDARYWGVWTASPGKPPEWPSGPGPRIYAYFKTCPVLPRLLDRLARSGHPTLVYVDGADPGMIQRAAAPTLRIESQRLDMLRVARECDVAIMHGTHGTAAALLLAGKPSLQLPIFLEQGMIAQAICNIGAATRAPVNDPDLAIAELQKLIAAPEYAAAARRFADRYVAYDPVESNDHLIHAIESLLAPTPARPLGDPTMIFGAPP